MSALQGKQVLFLTNNSMKSRQAYLGKFVQLGLPAFHVSRKAGAVRGTANTQLLVLAVGLVQTGAMQNQHHNQLLLTADHSCLAPHLLASQP